MITYRKSDGKFLIVKKPRTDHAWQFPQGGVDEGETYEEAAKRELKEELGSEKFQGFMKSKHVLFYEFPTGYSRDDKYTGHKQSYYFVEFLGDESDIELDKEELEDHRWIYQTELEEYIQSPEYLKKVQQVIYEFQDQL